MKKLLETMIDVVLYSWHTNKIQIFSGQWKCPFSKIHFGQGICGNMS